MRPGFLSYLRTASKVALFAGGIGAVVLMTYAGRHDQSILLLALFALWVLLPSLIFARAILISKRWSSAVEVIVRTVVVALTFSTLVIYALIAFGPQMDRKAFVFVVVPPVSCLTVGVAMGVAMLRFRKDSPEPR